MNSSLVSVILPVYNGERYVVEAIESVLSQDFSPIELIVINDGSRDGTAGELAQFGTSLRCIHQDNQGTAAARNRGVERAAGDFLAFIDQDDVWTGNKISLQIQEFLRDERLDMVLSHVELIFAPDTTPVRKRPGKSSPNFMPGYTPSAMLIKVDAFHKVGFFDERWVLGEWFDWYLRSEEDGLNKWMLPEILVQKRVHPLNKGLIYIDKNKEYVRILKNHLDRQRIKSRQ